MYEFTQNPNLTWDIVNYNSDKDWNWTYLSENKMITWDMIHYNVIYLGILTLC